jgi:cellulose synthase/poly-beta-1,6-N-acetylglucosamine synthase-like glycosyltransferase
MAWMAVALFSLQISLLLLFSFFAFFNYLYAIASLKQCNVKRVSISKPPRIAIVIVSFNERFVVEGTIRACEELTYANKLIILADDSTDYEIIQEQRRLAISKGCKELRKHPFSETISQYSLDNVQEPIEIWESDNFVLFHRPMNVGFKAGSLRKIQEYLKDRGIDIMYLLDADWHPQKDALERTLEVLEADQRIAFVQTKRVSFPTGMNVFQKYVTIVEEGCYHVDFEGRQIMGHPTLFSGCCTLFRMQAVSDVGGFKPRHLTEDLDLTDRLWLRGWRGVYLSDVVNYGEVPFSYDHYRRQQERWASGSARALKDYFWPILMSSKLGWLDKLSAIRQNAYFTTTLLTVAAIFLGFLTILWLGIFWNSYSVELYLYMVEPIRAPLMIIVYACILSNLAEPLVMIVVKKRSYRELLRLPMMVWYAWSVLPTYAIGNIKGLFNIHLKWFRTPKYSRLNPSTLTKTPPQIRFVNICICFALLCFYSAQGFYFGWFDEFSLILLPAFFLASSK